MEIPHDPHMDGLFKHYLVLNGFSANGAAQIVEEQAVTDPNDRHQIYEFLRASILPETHSVSKRSFMRHGR